MFPNIKYWQVWKVYIYGQLGAICSRMSSISIDVHFVSYIKTIPLQYYQKLKNELGPKNRLQ